jgi:hypothetical protein
MLMKLMLSIFLEKKTTKTNANSSRPSSQTEEENKLLSQNTLLAKRIFDRVIVYALIKEMTNKVVNPLTPSLNKDPNISSYSCCKLQLCGPGK